MPVKEASFWVFLALFSTGLYFIFERLDRVHMFGAILLLVVGIIGMVWVVYRHHYPGANLSPNGIWVWLGLALTWVVLGYTIYSDHYSKIQQRSLDSTQHAESPQAVPVSTPASPCPQPKSAPAKHKLSPTAAPPTATVPTTTINAPNGIGISGGSVSNPTVNNFGLHRPLVMTDAQQTIVVSLLSGFEGQTVDVNVDNGTIETGNFATALVSALSAAQITAKRMDGMFQNGCPRYGGVSFVAGQDRLPLVRALWNALLQAKVVDGKGPVCTYSGPKQDILQVFIRPISQN